MKTYPLAGVGSVLLAHRLARSVPGATVKATKTGEYRPPRAGEWFLSGATPEAYQTKNDLTAAYHVLRLVVVRTVEVEVAYPYPEKPHVGQSAES